MCESEERRDIELERERVYELIQNKDPSPIIMTSRRGILKSCFDLHRYVYQKYYFYKTTKMLAKHSIWGVAFVSSLVEL